MKTFECTECGSEIQSAVKPKRPCKCGARGKWKEVVKTGTPKTLLAAIENGCTEGLDDPNEVVRAKTIERHVRDFLAQKFGVAMLPAKDKEIDLLQDLWTKIVLRGI